MAIPIPYRASGFTLGDPSASVTIDVFFDIQCSRSARAWPAIEALIDHYSDQPVKLTAHIIAISDHRQAWDINLGLFTVANGDPKVFFDFVSFLFTRRDEFSNDVFRDKTNEDLRQLVADFAADFCGMDRAQLLAGLDDRNIYLDARTPIRYCATRSVWATPTFFINNADDVPVNSNSNLADWQAVIDPLLAPRS